MPRIIAGYILHPFRGAEWGELLCAMLGGVQFLTAMFAQDLQSRPGLEITLFWAPQVWAVAGLFLACGHVLALRFARCPAGYNGRIAVTALSLAFWTHLILSVLAGVIVAGQPLPILLPPAMIAPVLCAAVLYRLWRHYE